MFDFKRYLVIIVLVGCCVACNSAKDKPLDIDFSQDSSAIIIKNIDPVGMLKIKNGQLNDSLVQQLVKVLQSPAENDNTGMEQMVPGEVSAGVDFLRFKPSAPFEKGKHYMVETYINSQFGDLQSVIKSKTKFNMAPNQKTLLR